MSINQICGRLASVEWWFDTTELPSYSEWDGSRCRWHERPGNQHFKTTAIITIMIIITEMIFMVLSSWHSHCEFTRFIWWMQTQRRGGRQPSDQANRLRLRVRQKEMAATIHIHHRHFIITEPESWYSFYRPTEGGRLSRPRHCSKGVQPVPKAVYHSGCRDKHNCPRWD